MPRGQSLPDDSSNREVSISAPDGLRIQCYAAGVRMFLRFFRLGVLALR
jgi:hypothetical protein